MNKKPSKKKKPITSTKSDESLPGEYRLLPQKREPIPSRTDFNHDYVPLSGWQRRARRELIEQWLIARDPYTAKALREQEAVEIPFAEGLRFAYGKKADWRVAICIEAKYDAQSKRELADWLAKAAIENNEEELAAFLNVAAMIKKNAGSSAYHKSQCIALLYVMHCYIKTGMMPNKEITRKFLSDHRHPLPERKNEARDLFCGPVLGRLPDGKAGAKKSTSNKIKF